MTGEPCIIVNRTPDPLSFVADSKHYVLKPGDNFGFNTGHAGFAMRQNPLMGSGDFYSLEFQSLVGIKGADGYETDCTPISDDVLLRAMDEVEWFNREEAQLPGKVKRVQKPRSMSMRSNESSAGPSAAIAITAEA